MARTNTVTVEEAAGTAGKILQGKGKAAEDATAELTRKFNKEYGPLLEDARRASDLTATEGWQKLYGDARASFRRQRASLADRLAGMLQGIRDGRLIPEEVKAGKDTFKDYEVTETNAAGFDRQTVGPVRESAERCQQSRDNIIRIAQTDERNNPLSLGGLAGAVADFVDGAPRVEWDAESGRVTVTPTE